MVWLCSGHWQFYGDDTQPRNPNKTPKNALFGITRVRGRVQDVLNFHRSPIIVEEVMQSGFERSDVISGGRNVLRYFSRNLGVMKMRFDKIRGLIDNGGCD